MGALPRAAVRWRTHRESRLPGCRPAVIVGARATLYGRAGIGEAIGPFEPPTQGPVAQWLEPAAHNGLVGGSSPPGPTTGFKALRPRVNRLTPQPFLTPTAQTAQ
jgi:hypothetical protein